MRDATPNDLPDRLRMHGGRVRAVHDLALPDALPDAIPALPVGPSEPIRATLPVVPLKAPPGWMISHPDTPIFWDVVHVLGIRGGHIIEKEIIKGEAIGGRHASYEPRENEGS